MPLLTADRGIRVTLGAVCANQRWQIVVPYLKDSALVANADGVNVVDHFQTNIYPKWKDCFAADCYIDGILVESMCPGFIIPIRHIYTPTSFVGAVAGESYSPNASMLFALYASDQVTAIGQKTHVAKQFIGPPPEAKCAADSVDLAFVASELTTFGNALRLLTITGGGGTFYRALGTSNQPAVQIYTTDTLRVRSTVFTQRNRVKPVL